MSNIFKQILNKLNQNQRVYLLTVIQNSGSSPGRKGFKMMVAEDGFISGSIGGGIMEYKFVEKVKKILKTTHLEVFLNKQIHQKKVKNSSGMICSGEQIITLHPLNKTDINCISAIVNAINKNIKGYLKLTPNAIYFCNETMVNAFECKINSDTYWTYKEQLNYAEKVSIIGAGHVGLAVSKLLKTLNFNVEIFDDRNNLNTFNQNIYANKKQIVDFNEINKYIKEASYVLIMTTKYTNDKQVLIKLLKANKKFNYLGVLGSQSKIKTMFKELISEGFSKEKLQHIYAPIGLPINSQTPEEIAISIAAQIIKIKNDLFRRTKMNEFI